MNSANRMNAVAGTATGNTLKTASDNVRSLFSIQNGSEMYIQPQVQMVQDNTKVVVPIVDQNLE